MAWRKFYVPKKKYGNHVTEDENGNVFDSRKEYNRFKELEKKEKAHEISDLERQKKFVLIPTQKEKGKRTERPVTYIADFVYRDRDGNLVVEDTKSEITRKDPKYVIKRKLMRFFHNIEIQEV